MTEPWGWIVVCLGGLTARVDGQPTFGVKAYGPFETKELADEAEQTVLRRLEGGGLFVRPLVSLSDTIERISRD